MPMNMRKKDIINPLNVILPFVIIKLLDWRPAFYGFCSQQFAKRDAAKRDGKKSRHGKKTFSYTFQVCISNVSRVAVVQY